MSMTERERAARAIGYLEGLSAFLWSIQDRKDHQSLFPEACMYYDDKVALLRKVIFESEVDE